jgi:hypothetical protein
VSAIFVAELRHYGSTKARNFSNDKKGSVKTDFTETLSQTFMIALIIKSILLFMLLKFTRATRHLLFIDQLFQKPISHLKQAMDLCVYL